MSSGFRCSAAAEQRGDDLAGTASLVASYVLIEHPGPWGVKALTDSRFPASLGDALQRHAAAARARPLLVRRPDRAARPGPEAGIRVMVASTNVDDPFIETTTLPDFAAVLDLDLSALAAGKSLGLERMEGPLYAVCTHGKHDPCCAERGRPVAQALAAVEPERTWECSHLGGDRFAGNLVVLPVGLYYGRMGPETAIRLAAEQRDGRMIVEHLRGRSNQAMPAQLAEIALRRELGESRIAAVTSQGHTLEDGVTVARYLVSDISGDLSGDLSGDTSGDTSYLVRVRTTLAPGTAQLTCHATTESSMPDHEVLSIDRV